MSDDVQVLERKEAPSPPSLPAIATKTTYYRTALKISIILSTFLLLLLIFGPFGAPFAGSVFQAFITGLLFVSNIISLVFYSTAVKEQIDKGERRRALIIALFGLGGVVLGILLCIAIAPTIMNGILIVTLAGGNFLSFACRMDPYKDNPREVRAVWAALGVAALIIIAITLPAIWQVNFGLYFLKSLSVMNNASKWGIYPVVTTVLAAIGFAQYVAKAYSATDNPADKSKRWEYSLTALSFIVALALCIMVFTGLYPLSSIGLKIVLSIMICSQCASLASKLGKTIDETMQPEAARPLTPQPEKNMSLLNKLVEHPLWVYVARPFLVAGLFLMLGFAVFISSPLAVSSGLILPWALTPVFAFSLAALALAIIANLVIRWLQPTVVNIPSCQAIASAKQACDILDKLTDINPLDLDQEAKNKLWAALKVYALQAKQLLSQEWRKSLVSYRENTPPDNSHLDNDPGLADTFLENLVCPSAQELEPLKTFFNNLVTAEIDPTYRPAIAPDKAMLLLAVFMATLFGCVAVLFAIFTGLIPFAGLIWAMSAAAGLGFMAWLSANYFLNQTSGGPYATWAIFFGVAATVALALFFAAAFGGLAFAPIALLPTAGISFLLIFFSAYNASAAYDHAQQSPQEKSPLQKTWRYRLVNNGLLFLKVLFIAGFLLLAFLSIAASFNLGGLGPFSNLMTLAFDTILKALGPNGFTIGNQWFSAFAIGIFSIASFSAFELFKNVLEQSPSKAQDKVSPSTKGLLLIAKFVFVTAIMIALLFMPASIFSLGGAVTAMLPVLLMVAVVMPLLSGNADLPTPYLKEFNTWFNTYLGLKPFPGDNADWGSFFRELWVLALLAGLAGITYAVAGASASIALPVLGIGIGTTMLSRWGTMYWRDHHDPVAAVQDYLPGGEEVNDTAIHSQSNSSSSTSDLQADSSNVLGTGGALAEARDGPLDSKEDSKVVRVASSQNNSSGSQSPRPQHTTIPSDDPLPTEPLIQR